jgi:hypothetical protein
MITSKQVLLNLFFLSKTSDFSYAAFTLKKGPGTREQISQVYIMKVVIFVSGQRCLRCSAFSNTWLK